MLNFSQLVGTPLELDRSFSYTFLHVGGIPSMPKSKHDAQKKIQIVMEFLTTNTSTAELCRKHNLSPQTFYIWKEKFIQAGKDALSHRKTKSMDNSQDTDNLKKIIGELTIANDTLKKTLEASKR